MLYRAYVKTATLQLPIKLWTSPV